MSSLLRSRILWFGLFSLAVMVVVALVIDVPGHSGTDTAAHVYKVDLVRAGQPLVWDDYWYSGTYGAASYGVLYYEAAAIVGETALVILSAGLLPLFFLVFARRAWQVTSLVPALALVVLVATYLGSGENPFFVGLALMMGGAALLAAGRPKTAALPVAAALFVNPLAVLVVGVLLLADLVARPQARRDYLRFALALAPFALVRGALLLALRQPSDEVSFTHTQLRYIAEALLFLVAVRFSGRARKRPQEAFFALAALACLLSWLVPNNPVGQTMGRVVNLFAIPVLLTVPWRRVAVFAAAVVPALVLTIPWTALSMYFAHPRPISDERALFAPAVDLAKKLNDPNYRFEVVALHNHWEAYFFPISGLPLARGWFRQSDAAHNDLFNETYSVSAYVAWLRNVAVRYVFVPQASLDWSSEAEARFIQSSPQFRLVATLPHWKVYEFAGAQPMALADQTIGASVGAAAAPGGATVLSYERDRVRVAVNKPGTYVVKVSYSPYWTLSGPRGTIRRATGEWILLTAGAPGAYDLRIDGGIGNLLKHVL
jgi:hypothetical protein